MSDSAQIDTNSIRAVHPWHAVDPAVSGRDLTVYIENVPLDVMKYETDRESGILKIDHPFQTAALPPCAYGFVPRTLCGSRVAKLAGGRRGDQAALDVFVISERPISLPGVLARVRLLGGLPVKDQNRIDTKLISVLSRDPCFGGVGSISALPVHLLDRIGHFLTNCGLDDVVEVGDAFDDDKALQVLNAATEDYDEIQHDL